MQGMSGKGFAIFRVRRTSNSPSSLFWAGRTKYTPSRSPLTILINLSQPSCGLDLEPSLSRCKSTTGFMAIFDLIFGSEERGGVLRRREKEFFEEGRGFFEEGGLFEEGRRFFEEVGGSLFFGSEGRRTSPSSIFEPKDRRPSIFYLRSSDPKTKEPSIFDLRPRRMGRRSDGRKGGGGWWDFFPSNNESKIGRKKRG